MSVRAIGVSCLIDAAEFTALSPDDRKTFLREVNDHLTTELRAYVADLRPAGAPGFTIDGPAEHDGRLSYVATSTAPYETDDLSPLCRAYATHNVQRREGERR